MATMRITFGLSIEDLFVNSEQIQPSAFSVNLAGDGLRRTVSLPIDSFTTLDTAEVTPKWWFFQNIHATADLSIVFDAAEVIRLSPGEISFLRSSQIPYAKGLVGASRLLYGVYS